MMRSMYSGISGLKAHQIKMDVIGNNISNVNTIGFKSSRVTFQEVYNQTIRPAFAASQAGGRGGVNPQQIGLGVSVASIDVLHTRNAVQRTDKVTDLAIEGDGFFIVSDGINQFYTRAGNFDLDEYGNLVTAGGLYVLGWTDKSFNNIIGEETISTSGVPQKINLSYLSMPAKATDRITLQGNLDSGTAIGESIEHSTSIFDSLGNEHKVNIVFTKTAPNQWSWVMKPADMYTVDYPMNNGLNARDEMTFAAKQPVKYNNEIKSVKVNGTNYNIIFASSQSDFNAKKAIVSGSQVVILADGTSNLKTAFGNAIPSGANIEIEYNHGLIDSIPLSGTNTYHGEIRFTGDGHLDPSSDLLLGSNLEVIMKPQNGADTVTLDKGNIIFHEDKFTQFESDTTVKVSEMTGYAFGTLNSISINPEGRIIGIYTNGQSREEGVLSISSFSNPSGLTKIGDNLFEYSSNSGAVNIGRAGTDGRGSINPGALEMSNVDLAQEFTEMIVAQRGFQANSRIITTSDELLQELVNLKR